MTILFLGTGAADFPENREGVEGFRRTSSVLINDELLIDPGPWVLDAIKEFDVDVSKIKYIINTHTHSDHFCKDTLDYLCTQGAEFFKTDEEGTVNIGRYEIEVLRGNHTVPVSHFIIKHEDKCLFYGLDGAWLQYKEIEAIWKNKPDLAVFDATVGFISEDYRLFEHNNLNMVIEMKKSIGKDIKRYVISHMAYTLHTDHEKLSMEMAKHDIITAFDGMHLVF